MNTEEATTVEETPPAPDHDLIDGVEAEAMFAAELEPITAQVPKWPGCWFTLEPLDGMGMSKLYGAAQSIALDAEGKAQAGGFRMDNFERDLVCATVSDFKLIRRQRIHPEHRTPGGPAATDTEVLAAAVSPKLRAQFIRDTLCGDPGRSIRGLSPGLWRWLVLQCYRANHMAEPASGN